jgi:two-component system, NarL family, nitrate/nitrite response regulator NarL
MTRRTILRTPQPNYDHPFTPDDLEGDVGVPVKRSVATVILAPRTLLREGLTSLLHNSNFRVVASIATPDEISQLLPGRVGLVILYLSTGSREGLDYLEKISSTTRDYKIVVVAETSGLAGQPDISEILRSGADAYILNVHSRDVLLKSLDLAVLEQKLVVLGENGVPLKFSEVRTRSTQSNGAPPRSCGDGAARFSDRELEILSCLSCGDPNKIIARTCHIAESTVKIHLKSILRKIHVQNRTQAAIWAIQNGLYAASESVRDDEQSVPQLA